MRRSTLSVRPDHTWTARPDHKILVLDRGAVRIEYPRHWHVLPGEGCIKISDAKPPHDECALGISHHRFPPEAAELGVASLVKSTLERDSRPFSEVAPIVQEERRGLALAWGHARYVDAPSGREACTRICLARKGEIQALITFEFWLADLARCDPLWKTFIDSVRIGEWVEDPRRGPMVQ